MELASDAATTAQILSVPKIPVSILFRGSVERASIAPPEGGVLASTMRVHNV
jgi:hypothetical protein